MIMETFRLWFEDDKEIPQFKRLSFEKVNVPLGDVLTIGIHPWMGGNVHSTLGERFVQILNNEELKLEELAQAHYCRDISHSTYYSYYLDTTPFEETLKNIHNNVYFVDDLSYIELITLAKERLKKMWSHKIAYELLNRANHGFDAMRSFLKEKDRHIKLSGYADINRYNLGRILSLSDFEGEDNLIIAVGIPVANFRRIQFIERVTDNRGFLRLTNHIEHFQVQVDYKIENVYSSLTLLYNCQGENEKIRFRPVMDRDPTKRAKVKEFASRWRTDQGRYCFTTDISRLSQMVEENNCQILFPSLDYLRPRDGYKSYANIANSKVILHSPGNHLTCNASCDTMKRILRDHGVSMTGRKEDLIEKLAQLVVNLYQGNELEIETYFTNHKFIRVSAAYYSDNNTFPILEECDLRSFVLTMYIIKHLRGNTILETKHNNNTYDLFSLASALLKNEVSLDGSFLQVE